MFFPVNMLPIKKEKLLSVSTLSETWRPVGHSWDPDRV